MSVAAQPWPDPEYLLSLNPMTMSASEAYKFSSRFMKRDRRLGQPTPEGKTLTSCKNIRHVRVKYSTPTNLIVVSIKAPCPLDSC